MSEIKGPRIVILDEADGNETIGIGHKDNRPSPNVKENFARKRDNECSNCGSALNGSATISVFNKVVEVQMRSVGFAESTVCGAVDSSLVSGTLLQRGVVTEYNARWEKAHMSKPINVFEVSDEVS